MPQTSMLHVRVDDKLKADATEKLAEFGLTISDAVRILLTRVAKEGGLPAGLTTDARRTTRGSAPKSRKPWPIRGRRCRTSRSWMKPRR